MIETDERKMIAGVMRLGDRAVRGVMTPRTDVDWIDLDDDEFEIRHRAERQRADRSARRVRRQEPALHGHLHRGDRDAYGRERQSCRRNARARAAGRLRARAGRPRPHLDDKVLSSWNGLMIGAGARAGRIIGGLAPSDGAEYVGLAERAARFVRGELWHAETGTLLRRWRAGEAGIERLCEDYACLVWGALELFQATGGAEWLEWALALQARQDALFWDEADGGWFSTTGRDPSVLYCV